MLPWPDKLRGRRVVWYVDNTSAMASFVKGTSKSAELEKIVGLFWMLAWHFDILVWFEWVDSDSNWSDGASRLFQEDPFASAHQFRMQEMQQPSREWQLGWKQLWDYAARSAA